MKLKIKLDAGAKMPTRAHEHDAGYDLYTKEENRYDAIFPGGSCVFDTGVHMAIPKNHVGFIKSRSGLMVMSGVLTDGTIDSGYTGSIKVKLFNFGHDPVIIKPGEKIAQIVILPIITPELEVVDNLEDTERGDGGFGSTGKF